MLAPPTSLLCLMALIGSHVDAFVRSPRLAPRQAGACSRPTLGRITPSGAPRWSSAVFYHAKKIKITEWAETADGVISGKYPNGTTYFSRGELDELKATMPERQAAALAEALAEAGGRREGKYPPRVEEREPRGGPRGGQDRKGKGLKGKGGGSDDDNDDADDEYSKP